MKTGVRVVVIVALVIQGWWSWKITRYDAAFREGVRAYNDAKVSEVREPFRNARDLFDRDALLWAWIGDTNLYVYDYHAEGEIDPEWGEALLDEAWAAYAESVHRCPPYAWSWSGLSAVATRKVRLHERVHGIDITAFGKRRDGIWDPMRAIAVASGALAVHLKPFGFQELDILAEAYEIAGDQRRAEELLVKSASVMPAPSFHSWGIGRRLYGDLCDSILESLEDGVAKAPPFESAMLYLELGRFARLQADPERALDYFQRAESTAGNDYHRTHALRGQVGMLERLSRFDEAVEINRKIVVASYALPGDFRRMATLYDVLGRHEDACVAFMRTLRDDAIGSGWRIRASRSCARAGEFELAERILRDAISVPSEDLALAQELIEFLARHERTNTALNLLSVWMRDYPDAAQFAAWAENIRTGSLVVPSGIRRMPEADPGS